MKKLHIYGSKPPPNDSLWKTYKTVGPDTNLCVVERSKVTGGEKMVDTCTDALL